MFKQKLVKNLFLAKVSILPNECDELGQLKVTYMFIIVEKKGNEYIEIFSKEKIITEHSAKGKVKHFYQPYIEELVSLTKLVSSEKISTRDLYCEARRANVLYSIGMLNDFDAYIDLQECREFARIRHGKQTRKQGTPYYFHPYAVSDYLKEKGFSEVHQIVGLFHDLREDTDTTYDEILEISNSKIADAVETLTKKKGYKMQEYMKKIVADEIANPVKFSDRIHNLSEADKADVAFREMYIKETQDWFIEPAKGTKFEEDLNCKLQFVKDSLQS